jgi:hypothetical protein
MTQQFLLFFAKASTCRISISYNIPRGMTQQFLLFFAKASTCIISVSYNISRGMTQQFFILDKATCEGGGRE